MVGETGNDKSSYSPAFRSAWKTAAVMMKNKTEGKQMDEKDISQNLQTGGNSIAPAPTPEGTPAPAPPSEGTPAPAKPKLTKQKKIMLGGIAAIAIVAIAIIAGVARGSVFDQVRNEAMKQYPLANGTAGWVVSDDYIEVDTNPDDINPEKMTRAQYTAFEPVQDDSLGAIKLINKKLGFSSALYEKMMGTSALMGRQTEENEKFRVSWKYHPKNGLEVMYEKK